MLIANTKEIMKDITYIQGDATNPMGEGNKLIIHICNSVGGWGRGFVLSLSKKWKKPEQSYRTWFSGHNTVGLGMVQFVPVEKDITVANMIAQHDIRTINGIPPIRYEALEKCLIQVAQYTKNNNASVHLPYLMGAGLAGGKWEKIEEIIKNTLCKEDIIVVAYDIDGVRNK
jgi:O-acetyl-ADP-ribose deacetylase (regulator of RNase III)